MKLFLGEGHLQRVFRTGRGRRGGSCRRRCRWRRRCREGGRRLRWRWLRRRDNIFLVVNITLLWRFVIKITDATGGCRRRRVVEFWFGLD